MSLISTMVLRLRRLERKAMCRDVPYGAGVESPLGTLCCLLMN
jgi:hypothetical protein